MGNTTKETMLSILNNHMQHGLFSDPTCRRSIFQSPLAHHGMSDPFVNFDRAFLEMDRRRDAFLDDMEIDQDATPHSGGSHRTVSSSTSTSRSDGGEPVMQRREVYRDQAGNNVERTEKRIGDKRVQNTNKEWGDLSGPPWP